MTINYDKQATLYESTRNTEPLVYSALSYLLKPAKGEAILDFGCGTGNYLAKLVSDYEIEPYGVEPASNMRKIAQSKIQGDRIREGDHTYIPFSEPLFDKIYSTDVIHHIRQLDSLFINLFHASAPNARLCICTESPHQLEEKYWIKYFPEVLAADLKRFYPIETIIITGKTAGWIHKETLTAEEELIAPISPNFMERVEKKTLSAFCLIPDTAYLKGLSLMRADYQAKTLLRQCEGYTFVLFERGK